MGSANRWPLLRSLQSQIKWHLMTFDLRENTKCSFPVMQKEAFVKCMIDNSWTSAEITKCEYLNKNKTRFTVLMLHQQALACC